MVAVVNGDRIDIDNYQQRLERAVRFLKNHRKVTEENTAQILKFLEHIKAENLSLARQVSYVQWLTTIAVTLRRKDFTKTKKQNVEALLAKFNGREWSDATKENYREAVKKFWRRLRGLPKGEDLEETEWVKVGGAKGRKIIPEELLTHEEANSLIAAAEHPRDKAYAAVTDETGARPGHQSLFLNIGQTLTLKRTSKDHMSLFHSDCEITFLNIHRCHSLDRLRGRRCIAVSDINEAGQGWSLHAPVIPRRFV